jgi:hypothetical protein
VPLVRFDYTLLYPLLYRLTKVVSSCRSGVHDHFPATANEHTSLTFTFTDHLGTLILQTIGPRADREQLR